MMPNTTLHSCLSSHEMEQIGRNEVSPEELTAIEEHLSDCPQCRELFDSHYKSPQWSELIQPALLESQLPLSSVAADGIDHSAAILKLLGPTDDPNMLGRIGNYEIVGVIGQGGMGAVFKGFDRSLNRFVAIKMLLPHLAASGAARKRFAREGQAVAAVVDDHVMAIHCVDQWQGIPYLVMTYSRGISLQKRLNDSGPLELREILRIGMQAAKGLAAAHAQGIVHRDIKPSNILLDQNVERVQLVDFGLARAVDDASLTCSGTLAGTPQYMSPEQARAETVDHRSDLFSLGSVLYAMCTGYAPFRADSSYSVLRLIIEKEPRSLREVNSDIPDWLCLIIGKLMAKSAGDRFESAKQVAELLEACLAHVQQPTTVPLPSSVTRLALVSETASGHVPATKTGRRFTGTTIGKFFAAALAAAAMVLAGVTIVLELDKGTLTIKSVADNVPIRILQGKDTVQEFTVSKQGTTTRLRAGTYTVEIEADSTVYEIQGDNVVVKRGEEALVEIGLSKSAPNGSSNEQLVDGIQWSTYGEHKGLLSGARLILPHGGVYPGQPVEVEYCLKNVSSETKKLIVNILGNREHIAIGKDNRITDAGITTAEEAIEITIEPGKEYVATSHRASIETQGLTPGLYQVALGSAFFYPDETDPSIKCEIPHRGSISFEILPPNTTNSRPLSQGIYWGKSVSGLRLGAKLKGKSNIFAIGSIVEADLWIANTTTQAIECSILLPHPMDGWLFNIENQLGSTIMLERPPRISIFHPQEFFSIHLAPGEVRQLTGERIEGKADKFAGRSAKFEIVNTKENQYWGDHTIKGRLVTEGGNYSAIFDLTLQRPDIPKMRIELDSGNCPFTVGKLDSDAKATRELDEAITSDDTLALAIDRFNKRMRDSHPNTDLYNQPPLTKDELIAYASWNMERGDKLPATCKAGLAKIAKQHRLPENWTIDGYYGETSNGGEPVLAFQIFLQTDDSPAMQMVIRTRFLSPPKDYSLSTATNDPGGTSLAAAVKRFNARHSRVAGIEQPPLTEDEVVAAVLYTKARRNDHDVSDALFERFQNIARTRQLPEGATLEVIPTFGVEGGSTYTIWSIRLTMPQDEANKKGWTYGFLLREQFVSVQHGDASSIHWGRPSESGLQVGMRLSPPLKSYSFGQKISVELFLRNILSRSLPAKVPNFPHYDVIASDEEDLSIQSSVPQHKVVGGWRAVSIGDQPLSLRGQPLVFLPSTTSPEERIKIRDQSDNDVFVFVNPGKPFGLQLSVTDFANDGKRTLTTGRIELVVGTPDLSGISLIHDAETGTTTIQGSLEKVERMKSVIEAIQKAQPLKEPGASDSDNSKKLDISNSNANEGDADESIRDLRFILGIAESHTQPLDKTPQGTPIPRDHETQSEEAKWISMIDLLVFRSNQEIEDAEATKQLAFIRRRLLDHFEARVKTKLTQMLLDNFVKQEPISIHERESPSSDDTHDSKIVSLKQKAADLYQRLRSEAENATLDTDLHERQGAVKSELIVHTHLLKYVSSQKAQLTIRNTSKLFGIFPETPGSDVRTNTLVISKNSRAKYFTNLAAALDGAGEENKMVFNERIELWKSRLQLLAILRAAFDKNNPVEATVSTTARYRYILECIEFDRLELAQLGIDLDLRDLDSQASPWLVKNPSGFLALVVSLEDRGLARKVLTLSKRIESNESVEMTASRSLDEFKMKLRPQIKSDSYTADFEFGVTRSDLARSEKTQTRSDVFDCEGPLDSPIAMNVTHLFADDASSKQVILLLTMTKNRGYVSPK